MGYDVKKSSFPAPWSDLPEDVFPAGPRHLMTLVDKSKSGDASIARMSPSVIRTMRELTRGCHSAYALDDNVLFFYAGGERSSATDEDEDKRFFMFNAVTGSLFGCHYTDRDGIESVTPVTVGRGGDTSSTPIVMTLLLGLAYCGSSELLPKTGALYHVVDELRYDISFWLKEKVEREDEPRKEYAQFLGVIAMDLYALLSAKTITGEAWKLISDESLPDSGGRLKRLSLEAIKDMMEKGIRLGEEDFPEHDIFANIFRTHDGSSKPSIETVVMKKHLPSIDEMKEELALDIHPLTEREK